MAIETKLTVDRRTEKGSSSSRRMRLAGKIPANIYGLGQESIEITLVADVVTPAVVSGVQVVELNVDGKTETAMIREVQWDTFQTHILHVDFQRLDPTRRLDVEVPVHSRGTVNEGVLDHVIHHMTLNCPVYDVPEVIMVKVGTLKIGDTIKVSDLQLPPDVTTSLPADAVVFRVHEAQDVEIVQEDLSSGAQPELIGRAKDDEAE